VSLELQASPKFLTAPWAKLKPISAAVKMKPAKTKPSKKVFLVFKNANIKILKPWEHIKYIPQKVTYKARRTTAIKARCLQ
jgi:hypothetical protein